MVTTITEYACDICGSQYHSITRAHKCEQTGFIPPQPENNISVGDFVFPWDMSTSIGIDSSWCFDRGDYTPKSHLDLRYRYAFMVAGIGPRILGLYEDRKSLHENVYHVICPEHGRFMNNGAYKGWTCSPGHMRLRKIPDRLIRPEMIKYRDNYNGPTAFDNLL